MEQQAPHLCGAFARNSNSAGSAPWQIIHRSEPQRIQPACEPQPSSPRSLWPVPRCSTLRPHPRPPTWPPSATTTAHCSSSLPAPDDPSLLAQLTRLKDHAPGLDERNVLVIAVPYNNPAPTEVALTPEDALAARHRFHVAPADFTAVLLGKDGGEKLRSTKPLSFEKLRDKIDSMPMRQTEMSSGLPR